jgi:hypothetical protein
LLYRWLVQSRGGIFFFFFCAAAQTKSKEKCGVTCDGQGQGADGVE